MLATNHLGTPQSTIVARTYTPTQRAHAITTYLEHGLAEAHHRTGIPKSTLKGWLTEAGHDPAETVARSIEKTRNATEAHRAQMEAKRVEAQAEFAASAVFAARKVRDAEEGKDAHGWAMASGTMLDKLRLELGEVTDRTEHVAAPERAPDVEDELAKVLELVRPQAAA